jgi:hypothetical protein
MVQYNVVPEETYVVATEYDPELPSLTDAVIDEKEYVELGDTDANDPEKLFKLNEYKSS